MDRKTGGFSLLAVAVAAPLMLGAAQVRGAEGVDPAAPPPPQAELLPGLDLYNDRDQLLGTVERIETRASGPVALVSAGKNESRITGALVAVPVEEIFVDGQKIRVRLSRGAFEGRAVSEAERVRRGRLAVAR